MTPGAFTEGVSDGTARTGTIATAHGPVATPAFMPVGTRASVRALDSADLEALGAQIVLANTYHLELRPGSETVAAMGGLHGFMSWSGPTLTDSGGFQVFSLDPRIDDDGVTFRSTYDGSTLRLTPEQAVAVQERIGADIAMVLDQLIGLPSPEGEVRAAMERTLQWAERALAAHRRPDQALFGIVQGGVDADLRSESATRTAALGFVGFGIGGLSVGETAAERNRSLDAVVAALPREATRYVMGLGDTEGVLDAIERGCDLFDCVWPTRLARHGKVLTSSGDFSIRRAEFAADASPLEEGCECATCARYERAYLRHLTVTGELSALRLLSIHNLHYTLDLLRRVRGAIPAGRFAELRGEIAAKRG